MKRNYQIGEKIVPINKTPRIRHHDNCGTYYQRLEMNQDFLYVVGFDEGEEKRLGVPCYWCNVIPNIGGDSFAEKDLIPYVKKETEESSLEERVEEFLNNSILKEDIQDGVRVFDYASGGVLFMVDKFQKNVKSLNQPSKEDVVTFIQEFAKFHKKEFDETNPYLNIKTDSYLMNATTKPVSFEPYFHINVTPLYQK